jgi:hypothetical protein
MAAAKMAAKRSLLVIGGCGACDAHARSRHASK